MIDTGTDRPASIAALVAGDGRISLRDFTAAERLHRRVIANVWACETLADLDAYEDAETLLLDALDAAHPELAAAVMDAIETHRGCLTAATPSAQAVPHPAAPGSPPAHSGNPTKATTMFDIDTGSSGSEGPWLSWSARGTQDGLIPPQSFYIRDANGKTRFDGFASGVVLDVANMKTGWQRSEGVLGQAPDWRWNKTVSRFEPAPGEDYKKGFSIRCAIGSGLTATWEQAGAAAWNGFVGLVPQLQQAPAGDMLPLVKLTGTKAQKFARGSTVEPVLTVVKWVPRPACLAEGAGIATEPEPPKAPAAQPRQPAPQQSLQDALSDDIPF